MITVLSPVGRHGRRPKPTLAKAKPNGLTISPRSQTPRQHTSSNRDYHIIPLQKTLNRLCHRSNLPPTLAHPQNISRCETQSTVREHSRRPEESLKMLHPEQSRKVSDLTMLDPSSTMDRYLDLAKEMNQPFHQSAAQQQLVESSELLRKQSLLAVSVPGKQLEDALISLRLATACGSSPTCREFATGDAGTLHRERCQNNGATFSHRATTNGSTNSPSVGLASNISSGSLTSSSFSAATAPTLANEKIPRAFTGPSINANANGVTNPKQSEGMFVTDAEVRANDVLLGRGTISHDQGGNIAFRSLIRQKYKEYQDAPVRGDKMKLARAVIATIRAKKGRFLRRLDPEEAIALTRAGQSLPSSSPAAAPGEVYEIVTDEKLLLQKTKQAFRHKVRQHHTRGEAKAKQVISADRKSQASLSSMQPCRPRVTKAPVATDTHERQAHPIAHLRPRVPENKESRGTNATGSAHTSAKASFAAAGLQKSLQTLHPHAWDGTGVLPCQDGGVLRTRWSTTDQGVAEARKRLTMDTINGPTRQSSIPTHPRWHHTHPQRDTSAELTASRASIDAARAAGEAATAPQLFASADKILPGALRPALGGEGPFLRRAGIMALDQVMMSGWPDVHHTPTNPLQLDNPRAAIINSRNHVQRPTCFSLLEQSPWKDSTSKQTTAARLAIRQQLLGCLAVVDCLLHQNNSEGK